METVTAVAIIVSVVILGILFLIASNKTYDKLDEIHTLVNSNMTQALKEIDSLNREVINLKSELTQEEQAQVEEKEGG